MKLNLILVAAVCAAAGTVAETSNLKNTAAPGREDAPSRAPAPKTFQIISAGPDSLAPGQSLRYTWGNLNDPDPEKRVFEPASIQVTIFSCDGGVLLQKEAAAVEPGKFQSFDFHRDELSLPGEPGADSLQVRLEIVVSGDVLRPGRNLQEQILATFDDHAEVIDDLTGETSVSSKPKEIVVVGSRIDPREKADFGPAGLADEMSLLYQDIVVPVGIAPRQTLRLDVALPSVKMPEGGEYTMSVLPLLLDAEGNVIARRDEITLAPGQCSSFDFARAELPPGEPGTDRLQVRAIIQRQFFPESAARLFQGKAPGSLEVIADGTSKAALLLPIVQTARPSPTPPPEEP